MRNLFNVAGPPGRRRKTGPVTWFTLGFCILALSGLMLQADSALTQVVPESRFDRSGDPLNVGKEVMETAAIENCFYFAPVATDPGWNSFFPEPNSAYPSTIFKVPEGAELFLEGEFPHARYVSFTQYYPGAGLGGAQAINDIEIEPDPGSVNPFRDGERRKAKNRSYTLRFEFGAVPEDPASREPNTIYLGSLPARFPRINVMRIYVPDKGTTPAGGVALPTPVLKMADGTVLRDQAACDELTGQFNGRVPFPQGQWDPEAYQAARDNHGGEEPNYPFTHPAQNPAVWNTNWATAFDFCINFTPELDCGEPVGGGNGLGNPANRYLKTYIDRGHGDVFVMRGKKPKTATTYFGDPFTEYHGTDMRFFSITAAETLYSWRSGDGVFDEEIPADSDGFYTVAISRPRHRPTNATYRCGVAWIEWPAAGDGFGDIHLARVATRFTLTGPDFAPPVTEVGGEEEAFGDWYPQSEYMSTEEFDERFPCSDSDSDSD